jgi:ferrous iron transport protein B
VALVGVPNTGKSTIFNLMTGMDQEIGNWPGVTVERKEGNRRVHGTDVRFMDLPGCQSLSGRAVDELVTREVLHKDMPDLILQIADASSPERSFFLLSELMDLAPNMVLVLNMMDSSRKKGDSYDIPGLQRELGIPIIAMSGRTGEGLEDLLMVIHQRLSRPKPPSGPVQLGEDIEKRTKLITKALERAGHRGKDLRSKALSILKGGPAPGVDPMDLRKALEGLEAEEVELAIADSRYAWSREVLSRSLKRGSRRDRLTEVLDPILADHIIGVPVFLVVLWGIFLFTFSVAEPLMLLIDTIFTFLSSSTSDLLGSSYLADLVSQGILGGVGAVMVFSPSIFILFISISLLEESGYMARAAFLMDGLMQRLGLPGRSFIPLVMGFGCNVPAIMAARTIEEKNDRLLTILITPFIPCSARLPVFLLLSGVFFGAGAGLVVILLYGVGVTTALISALVLRKLFFKGRPMPFIMELPPYRPPSFGRSMLYAWKRALMYMKKAGTVILAGAVIVWVLSSVTPGLKVTDDASESVLGKMGKALEPVFKPIGSDWRMTMTLSFGIFAKEMVVGGMGVLFDGDGEGTLNERLEQDTYLDPLKAFSFMVFVLLYMPCLATFSAIRNETGSWRWSIVSLVYSTIVAYLVSLVVYQGGLLLGL